MKIAILYICTGKYNQFFEEFYRSSEKYFLPQIVKHYFVWTDDMGLCNMENVTLIEKICKGFPMDSLMRFKMFLEIKDKLIEYTYAYFFNSNMLFVANVGEEVLPNVDGQIVFTLNAGYYNKTVFRYPFERNRSSCAFIEFKIGKKYKYVIGGLNGGKVLDYLSFSEECHRNICEDIRNGVLAIFHDESHINKYYSIHGGKLLPPAYAYPEDVLLPFKPIILIRDKVKIDKYFDKVVDHSFKAKLRKGMKIFLRAMIWPWV